MISVALITSWRQDEHRDGFRLHDRLCHSEEQALSATATGCWAMWSSTQGNIDRVDNPSSSKCSITRNGRCQSKHTILHTARHAKAWLHNNQFKIDVVQFRGRREGFDTGGVTMARWPASVQGHNQPVVFQPSQVSQHVLLLKPSRERPSAWPSQWWLDFVDETVAEEGARGRYGTLGPLAFQWEVKVAKVHPRV